MTIDDRLIFDLADLLAIQFECRKCQTTVNYPPPRWNPKPLQCPNCARSWWGDNTGDLKTIEDLAGAIRALLGNAERAEFRIRLVMEHPG